MLLRRFWMSKQKVKCLVTIVNRGKGSLVADICRSYQIYFTCGTLALGTAGSELLYYLGIGETDKEMLFSFLPACLERDVMHEIAGRINIKKPGHGIMFTVPLSGISTLFRQKVMCESADKEEYMEQAERKYELVVAVVDHGFQDQVMDAARAADATGGTVFHARSLHDEDASSFLGIRLQGEKDVVMSLSEIGAYTGIMQAVNAACGLKTEAKGLIFSLPVDHFIGI